LNDPPFANRTGRGVRIAIIDSGIHAGHPHVGGGVAGGICLVAGEDPVDIVDRVGHGTAVAAAIREKCPEAELLVVRVFDRQLATSAAVLAQAIVWSADHRARIINLSLGTTNPAHADALSDAVGHAVSHGAIVVAARENGIDWLPGSLPGVTGALVDWGCERDAIEIADKRSASRVFRASGYPRPIPGVPKERNLSGVSFAVANVSGFLARALEGDDSAICSAAPVER
jgi:subtilisin family serine protease